MTGNKTYHSFRCKLLRHLDVWEDRRTDQYYRHCSAGEPGTSEELRADRRQAPRGCKVAKPVHVNAGLLFHR